MRAQVAELLRADQTPWRAAQLSAEIATFKGMKAALEADFLQQQARRSEESPSPCLLERHSSPTFGTLLKLHRLDRCCAADSHWTFAQQAQASGSGVSPSLQSQIYDLRAQSATHFMEAEIARASMLTGTQKRELQALALDHQVFGIPFGEGSGTGERDARSSSTTLLCFRMRASQHSTLIENGQWSCEGLIIRASNTF